MSAVNPAAIAPSRTARWISGGSVLKAAERSAMRDSMVDDAHPANASAAIAPSDATRNRA